MAHSSEERPTVTIIMPIRNEEAFIERSLGAVLAQDYPPECVQVFIVEGMSDDGTRDVVQQVIAQQSDQDVVLLDNPGRIVPVGLNRGLQYATGEVIIRVDGHCEIAPDYVRRCVEALHETGAECVGGALETIGHSLVARAIALAQSAPFGVGGAVFRTGRSEGVYVDTLAFGAYKREVFEHLGGFDEELVRNQDDEFNFRLTQAGGKIWLDPSIRSVYYSRASLWKLWRQYFQYGFYKVRVIQKRGAVPAWRHLVPAVFVASLVFTFLPALLTGGWFWLAVVAGPYAAANFFASLWTARKNWRTLPLLPLVFLVLHLAYGAGFLGGLWHWRSAWRADAGRLSADPRAAPEALPARWEGARDEDL